MSQAFVLPCTLTFSPEDKPKGQNRTLFDKLFDTLHIDSRPPQSNFKDYRQSISSLRQLWRSCLKMAAKAFIRIQKLPYFSYFPMNLGMHYTYLMFFDITKSKFVTENFKMAAFFKMVATDDIGQI